MRLMANSGSIPEIGVFVEGGVQQPVAGVPVAVAQPEHSGPLTGKYGVHLKMRMYDKMKQRWIPGTSGVLNTLTPRPPPIPPPLRYQVRSSCFQIQKNELLMSTATLISTI